MWKLPEQYTAIPKVSINDYRWYVITNMSISRIHTILYTVKDQCEDNILWLPFYTEHKRLENHGGNQVIAYDKLIYYSYGFVGLLEGCTNVKILEAELRAQNLCSVVGYAFPKEMEQVFHIARTYAPKKTNSKLKKGSLVTLTSGPFFGMTATVLYVDKERVKLELIMGNNVVQMEASLKDVKDNSEEE